MATPSERTRAPGGEPVIAAARIAAGHDGGAELVVTVRHPGGGVDTVTLGPEPARRLLEHCGAASVEALHGRSWHHLMHVLG